MVTRSSSAILVLVAAWFSVGAGCGQNQQEPPGGQETVAERGDGYNPHDVPITEEQTTELRDQTARFVDAVAMIKKFRNEIEQETASGIPENPYTVHQALDKSDLILQWLPEIARNSGVAKEHWEAVNTSANELRTLFERVHQRIDNKQAPDFAAVASQIDQELADLEQIATAPAKDQ